ncbi:hypothetical protein, partial [Rhodococcus sp. T7]
MAEKSWAEKERDKEREKEREKDLQAATPQPQPGRGSDGYQYGQEKSGQSEWQESSAMSEARAADSAVRSQGEEGWSTSSQVGTTSAQASGQGETVNGDNANQAGRDIDHLSEPNAWLDDVADQMQKIGQVAPDNKIDLSGESNAWLDAVANRMQEVGQTAPDRGIDFSGTTNAWFHAIEATSANQQPGADRGSEADQRSKAGEKHDNAGNTSASFNLSFSFHEADKAMRDKEAADKAAAEKAAVDKAPVGSYFHEADKAMRDKEAADKAAAEKAAADKAAVEKAAVDKAPVGSYFHEADKAMRDKEAADKAAAEKVAANKEVKQGELKSNSEKMRETLNAENVAKALASAQIRSTVDTIKGALDTASAVLGPLGLAVVGAQKISEGVIAGKSSSQITHEILNDINKHGESLTGAVPGGSAISAAGEFSKQVTQGASLKEAATSGIGKAAEHLPLAGPASHASQAIAAEKSGDHISAIDHGAAATHGATKEIGAAVAAFVGGAPEAPKAEAVPEAPKAEAVPEAPKAEAVPEAP